MERIDLKIKEPTPMDANEALKQYRRNIYEFIDYLHKYASDMKIDLETIDEINKLGQKQGKLDYRGNYNDRVKYEELESKIHDKINELSFPNLIDVKAKELKLYQYSTIEIRNNLDPARHILDDIKPKEIQQIIEAKDKYLTFRKETQFCTFLNGALFIDLDEGLREFFRLFTDVSDMERVLPQPIPTPTPQIEPEKIKNNFDSGDIGQAIEHFRELEKKAEESVNQFTYAYGEEYETIQRCFDAYFKKEGIIIPASADEFLTWLAVKYPDDPTGHMVTKAKDPHNYKLFHEYQVRRLNNSGWDLNSEFKFWQKGWEHEPNNKGNLYEVDRMLVERIFDFCQNEVKKPIFKIDKTEFLKRFERADFSGDICTRRNKTKIRTIVYKVSLLGAMNDNWYTDAVESLGITKSQCSGFYYEQSFGNGLETIIKEYQNMKLKLNELTSELDKSINRKIKQSNPK